MPGYAWLWCRTKCSLPRLLFMVSQQFCSRQMTSHDYLRNTESIGSGWILRIRRTIAATRYHLQPRRQTSYLHDFNGSHRLVMSPRSRNGVICKITNVYMNSSTTFTGAWTISSAILQGTWHTVRNFDQSFTKTW